MRHSMTLFILLLLALPIQGAEESTLSSLKTGLKEYAGPALNIVGGNVGWGLVIGAHTRTEIVLPLTIGLESGFKRYVNGETRLIGIPLLVTAAFQLDTLIQSNKIHPYVGTALGGNLVLATNNVGNRFYTQFMVYPGAAVDLSDSLTLNVETRLGLSNVSPIFMPLAALEFKL